MYLIFWVLTTHFISQFTSRAKTWGAACTLAIALATVQNTAAPPDKIDAIF